MKRLLAQRIAVVFVLAATVSAADAAPSFRLVVESARDVDQGFVARDLDPAGRRLLAWPEGVVSAPDTMAWRPADDDGLAFALVRERLGAAGAGGRLDLAPGRFAIDTPLLLDDGNVTAFFAAGDLEISGDEIRYRREAPAVGRGGTLLLLAGLAVATAVLLRAARRRTRRP